MLMGEMIATGIALMMGLQTKFGEHEGEVVSLYTLRNKRGMTAKIMDYGATVVSLTAPDRNGKYGEVTLGYDEFSQYPEKSPYFGCTVGRFGNRIAKGKFTLDGKEYSLPINNGENSLHGGTKGFDKLIWKVVKKPTAKSASITFALTSPDGDQGYPGKLDVQVTYTLTAANELKIDYVAKTDKATVVNLTNHTYFNLSGGKDILGHKMQILADAITPVSEALIPTGKLMPVKGTPFDFNKMTVIGKGIDADHEQIKFGGGYDHNWVVRGKGLRKIAAVHDPATGRYMEVKTTEPGVQFYSGNFMDGTHSGHGGFVHNKRSGFCLETQHFPDSPNHKNFPSTVLRPGKTYRTTTIYKLSAR